MGVTIASRAEPLPGYKLIERIGSGGFGEVWKAEAPGGMYKAIKFVFGDIGGVDEEGARAEQELKALKRVKELRHPYILNIERYDIIENQLVIVMELADRTLWDRFKECRMDGMQGIPREELLKYLRETAEALDLMNTRFGLQHLDIKPQNLFLVYDHVKVADFGLIKDLQGAVATVTGGITPVYAPPETFDGIVSRTTDQYSLAIVYQELLTGKRPFSGLTARQLVLQHLQGEPDLTPLPFSDRDITKKALNKDYQERYGSCTEFIQALESARDSATMDDLDETDEPELLDTPLAEIPKSQLLTNGSANGARTSLNYKKLSESQSKEKKLRRDQTPDDAAFVSTNRIKPISKLAIGVESLPPSDPQWETSKTSKKANLPKTSADGILLPALVIGLGESGQHILKQVRRQIQDSFDGLDPLPNIRFLCVDTNAAAIQRATKGEENRLRPSEVIHARLQRASNFLKRSSFAAEISEWLPQNTLYRISRQPDTEGLRSLGRLAFVDNYRTFHNRLQPEINHCLNADALKKAARATGLGIATTVPRVFIITNLAGGAGSGMLIDLAYLVQDLLKRSGVRKAEVVGYCLCPSPDTSATNQRGLANAYATLKEINHFSSPESIFRANYPDLESPNKTKAFASHGPPLHRCHMISIEAPSATFDNSPGDTQVADLLVTELCTGVGRKADQFHSKWKEAARKDGMCLGTPVVYQVTGSNRIIYPRKHMIGRVARRLCVRLVENWMSKDAAPLKKIVQALVDQNLVKMQLSNDELIQYFQTKCQKSLGKRIETLLREIVDPMPPDGTQNPGQNGKPGRRVKELNLAQAAAALREVEQLLGVPDGCQSVHGPNTASSQPTGKIMEILGKTAAKLGRAFEKSIVELVVRLIEQPESRLAGAEEAIRQFTKAIQESLTHQEHLMQELRERSVSSYERILTLLDQVDKAPQSQPPSWAFSLTRRTSTPKRQKLSEELIDLLNKYPKSRYQFLILQHVGSFYVALRGSLSDQLRDMDFCRDRLRELKGKFEYAPARSTDCQSNEFWQKHLGRVVLPDGCDSIDRAIEDCQNSVHPDGLLELDNQIEHVIRRQFKALVQICFASSNVLHHLAPAMESTAQEFLSELLEDNDVVELCLDAKSTEKAEAKITQNNLMECYRKATPRLCGAAELEEFCISTVPDSPNRSRLVEEIQESLTNQQLEFAESVDEIRFYRERLFACPGELKQLGEEMKTAYEQAVRAGHIAPHSRYDISKWKPLG